MIHRFNWMRTENLVHARFALAGLQMREPNQVRVTLTYSLFGCKVDIFCPLNYKIYLRRICRFSQKQSTRT